MVQSPVSAEPQLEKSLLVKKGEGESAVVTLGGYSYGSLIVKHLPPLPTIMQPFVSPLAGSAANEVLLRARKLADQSNREWINSARHDNGHEIMPSKKRHERKLSVTMGGEETNPDKRRPSREIRRSTDGSPSRGIGHRFKSTHQKSQKDEDTPPTPSAGEEKRPSTTATISMPSVRYLLISPLTPPVSTLAAPALASSLFWNRSKEGGVQELIGRYPSLVVYGDQDIFTSTKKTRQWAEQVKTSSGSQQLTSIEVEGAGHFWVESGVEEILRVALREWESGIRE